MELQKELEIDPETGLSKVPDYTISYCPKCGTDLIYPRDRLAGNNKFMCKNCGGY